jgi:hypothetical protein
VLVLQKIKGFVGIVLLLLMGALKWKSRRRRRRRRRREEPMLLWMYRSGRIKYLEYLV